jgi:hypothetical protein
MAVHLDYKKAKSQPFFLRIPSAQKKGMQLHIFVTHKPD